ncbi:8623_t:CDS:2, partial [Ambispora gerdemannii]
RLALLEQDSAMNGMMLLFDQTQNDKEAMLVVIVSTVNVSSSDVTKISEVTDILTSEQGLSQSYKASSESIILVYCILLKQPQVDVSKLAYNFENREDSS